MKFYKDLIISEITIDHSKIKTVVNKKTNSILKICNTNNGVCYFFNDVLLRIRSKGYCCDNKNKFHYYTNYYFEYIKNTNNKLLTIVKRTAGTYITYYKQNYSVDYVEEFVCNNPWYQEILTDNKNKISKIEYFLLRAEKQNG